jgi:hypothetical protein
MKHRRKLSKVKRDAQDSSAQFFRCLAMSQINSTANARTSTNAVPPTPVARAAFWSQSNAQTTTPIATARYINSSNFATFEGRSRFGRSAAFIFESSDSLLKTPPCDLKTSYLGASRRTSISGRTHRGASPKTADSLERVRRVPSAPDRCSCTRSSVDRFRERRPSRCERRCRSDL